MLEAIAKHRVVILGEIHDRPRYWAFNAALVRVPEFARRAGVIYMELPSNDQPLVERFLAAKKYDREPIVDMLRDMMENGWPDQPTLDFFRTVWEVNQKLPAAERLRIVLVDMARPWKDIQKREDWAKYDVDRDQCMAENIVRDLARHGADKRHALFIAGYAHAMLNLTWTWGEPMRIGGWHLREKLGAANVFAVFPHGPVITNHGDVSGRIALGLFDTAFAALDNKPMAFPLDHGPFGREVFDADSERVTSDPYSKGYQGYLYLRPIEGEISSRRSFPVFTAMSTSAKWVDRRVRIMWERAGGKRADSPPRRGHLRGDAKPVLGPAACAVWSADYLGPLDAWNNCDYQDAARKRIPSPPAKTGKVIELYDVRSGVRVDGQSRPGNGDGPRPEPLPRRQSPGGSPG